MKRFGALVVAIALVLAAVVARRAIEGKDPVRIGPKPARGALYCDVSLTATCAAFGKENDVNVVFEEPGATLERLSVATTADLSGWIAIGPWAEMTDSIRSTRGLPKIFDKGSPIARTGVVLVSKSDRVSVLASRCESVDMRCVGDVAGAQWSSIGGDARWGNVVYGQDTPSRSNGLACLSSAATAYFETNAIASNDFADDPSFSDWLGALMRAVPEFDPNSGSNLREFLTQSGSRSVVCTTEAEAASLLATSRDRASISTIYPTRPTVIDVVSTSAAGAKLDIPSDVKSALAADHLRTGKDAPSGVAAGGAASSQLPDRSTLPAAGVLNALRTLWNEVAP